jgi:site-specific DNA recombinase
VSRPVALYARVSTEDQAQRYGLDSQVHELRALAERKGYQIVGEFLDDGISGATLDRPALTRLRDNLKLFQVILVHAPDRLSRVLVHQLILMEEFKKAQVAVEFSTTPTEDTAEGRLLLNIQGVIGEFEREKIKERTLRGKREKARRGMVVAPGNAPYGYRPDPARPGHLMICEPEAETVKLVYRLCIDEGRSLDGIVAELQRLGTPSTKAAQGRRWGRTQVARILSADRYTGTMHYGEEQVLPSGRRKPGSNPISIAIPAIITPGHQAAARTQLTKNKAVLVGRPRNFSYMLTGIIRRITCNARYESVPAHGRRYYRHQATPRPAAARGSPRSRRRPRCGRLSRRPSRIPRSSGRPRWSTRGAVGLGTWRFSPVRSISASRSGSSRPRRSGCWNCSWTMTLRRPSRLARS